METGAVLAVTLQDANAGDTTTIQQTLIAVAEQMEKLTEKEETAEQVAENWLAELVTDKGYHSNETMVDLKQFEIRSYISEPKRGRRNWIGKSEERDAVYANRRRIQGERGKSLLRRRGLMVERPFAPLLRNRSDEASSPPRPREYPQTAPYSYRRVQSELGAAFNDRQYAPRGLQDLAIAYFFTLLALANQIWRPLDAAVNFMPHKSVSSGYLASVISNVKIGVSATGCHENIHVTLID